jgi:hypothetical protein
MRIEKVKCDQCGFEADDRYERPGWTHIEGATGGSTNITVHHGRKKDKTGDTEFKQVREVDLCSWDCLRAWFAKFFRGKVKK